VLLRLLVHALRYQVTLLLLDSVADAFQLVCKFVLFLCNLFFPLSDILFVSRIFLTLRNQINPLVTGSLYTNSPGWLIGPQWLINGEGLLGALVSLVLSGLLYFYVPV
jgi:hypothetical protein